MFMLLFVYKNSCDRFEEVEKCTKIAFQFTLGSCEIPVDAYGLSLGIWTGQPENE